MDSIPPAVVAQLAEAQHFIFVTQIHFCAMYAVVIWDWVISLPREYRFIWKSDWTAAKFAYLFCRYWAIFAMPYVLFCYVSDHTMETCQKIYRAPVALAMWNQIGAEAVLLIRTYAFFNRNIYLLAVLSTGLICVLAYQLYVDLSQMLILPFVVYPFDKGPCLPMSKPGSAHILGFFLASLAFDATVTTMTLWKAFRLRRMCGSNNSPLIQTFLREGVFYFIFISIANLINGIFYLQPKAVMSAICIPLSIMFADILACRMILDLRERGYELTQPTVYAAGYGGPSNGTPVGGSGTICNATISQGKSLGTTISLGQKTTTQFGSTSKGSGIKSYLSIGRPAAPGLTNTIDSLGNSSQTDLERGLNGEGVELQSFTPQIEDDEKPETVEGIGLPFGAAPAYHVVDMSMSGMSAPGSGVRIDVEKTSM